MTGCTPDEIAARTVASRNIVLATGTARGLEWFASLNNRFRRLPIESLIHQPACDVEAHVTDARPRNLPNVARPLHPRRHGSRAPGSQPSINEAHSEKMRACDCAHPYRESSAPPERFPARSHPRRIKVGVELLRNLGFPAYSSSIVIGVGMADHGDTHALVLIHVIAFL